MNLHHDHDSSVGEAVCFPMTFCETPPASRAAQTSISTEGNEAKKEWIAEVYLALCSLCCLLFPSSEFC